MLAALHCKHPGVAVRLSWHIALTRCRVSACFGASIQLAQCGRQTRSQTLDKLCIDEPQSRDLWLDIIIAQSDAHNFDAALNNYGLQPVGPRSVEAFQRTDVDSTDYDRAAVCSTVSQLRRSRSRSHFAARRAAAVSARRHLERPRFTASSRSAVPVQLSKRSPSRNCADRSMLNSLTQIQRQRRSSRRPTPNLQL